MFGRACFKTLRTYYFAADDKRFCRTAIQKQDRSFELKHGRFSANIIICIYNLAPLRDNSLLDQHFECLPHTRIKSQNPRLAYACFLGMKEALVPVVPSTAEFMFPRDILNFTNVYSKCMVSGAPNFREVPSKHFLI